MTGTPNVDLQDATIGREYAGVMPGQVRVSARVHIEGFGKHTNFHLLYQQVG